MYSVVLLAALSSGGSATPAWCHSCGGGLLGCHGCYGCYGTYGISCYGCHGCNGCYGYTGCYGFGGCYGGYYGSGFGGYGGYCSGCFGCSGCYGGYGCYSYYGGATYMPGSIQSGPIQSMPPATDGASFLQPAMRGTTVAATAQPAKVIIELPEDATLFVDDQVMKTTSAKRVFRTPDLEPGQTYYYMLRAEVTRDGKPLRQTKRILIRAGAEVRTDLTELEPVSTAQTEAKPKAIAAR
jgi:uncharacterized protein (TIGR03000 family)